LAKRVVILEDDQGVQQLLRSAVETEGWLFDWGETFQEIRPLLARADVLILDLNLPDVNGLDVLRHINKSGQRIEVIVVTGDASKRRSAQRLGVSAFLEKPFDMSELYVALRDAARVVDLRSVGELPDPELTNRRPRARKAAPQ